MTFRSRLERLERAIADLAPTTDGDVHAARHRLMLALYVATGRALVQQAAAVGGEAMAVEVRRALGAGPDPTPAGPTAACWVAVLARIDAPPEPAPEATPAHAKLAELIERAAAGTEPTGQEDWLDLVPTLSETTRDALLHAWRSATTPAATRTTP